MLRRAAAGAITALVIGFAGAVSPALAQVYPPAPRYCAAPAVPSASADRY